MPSFILHYIFIHQHCLVNVILQCDLLFLFHRRTWVNPRSHDWWQLIQTTWTDRDWLKNLTMRKCTFQNLCGVLQPYLTWQHTRYRRPHSVEICVAICLWRLATNLEFRSISHLFGVGILTCCLITQEVITAINTVLKPHYLKRPFVGVIDGTHVPIKAPTNTPADYFNRKGQYSVILRAVVDHKMRIWDVNIGQPGRVHDIQSDKLFPHWNETIEGVNAPLLILGDAAYPLLPRLMKPFRESIAMTADQRNFNYRLSQGRMTVERAFGCLKGRWRCLLKQNESHISLISQVILECCVLHNFYEVHHEQYIGEENEELDDEASEDGGELPAQVPVQRAQDI
uniref:DDE Tnp4 domain-containing protein n=1 Tax=Kryptolebias marmoratus TaxID=37003 RepID=A0A3Q3ASA1_KRYMA